MKPLVPDSLRQRVQGIDVLRGLCIVTVVVHHFNIRIHLDNSPWGKNLPSLTKVLFWSGYYGVIVFFVISGFLITTWSLKRWSGLQRLDRRQFYRMRFARIAPCLLGLLVILSILDRLGVPRFTINTQHTSLPRALLAALTFHSNWLESRTGYLPAAWDVLWSLSVEEMFYLCFPLLCTWIRKEWLLIALLSGFVVLGPFARTVLTTNTLWADYGYFSCMDGIALGCLAAILAGRVKFSKRSNLALRVSGTLLCILIVVFRGTVGLLGLYKISINVTVLELGTALLLIALQQNFETKNAAGNQSTALLRWFGRNSYEIYLTHMLIVWPLVWAFYRLHQTMKLAPFWFIAVTALAGVAGYAVARFYSEPVNRKLRTRFLAKGPVPTSSMASA